MAEFTLFMEDSSEIAFQKPRKSEQEKFSCNQLVFKKLNKIKERLFKVFQKLFNIFLITRIQLQGNF